MGEGREKGTQEDAKVGNDTCLGGGFFMMSYVAVLCNLHVLQTFIYIY